MNNVTIVRSTRRKTISIQIMPDVTVTVSAPHAVSVGQIEKFLREKADWIEHNQQLMRSRNPKSSSSETYLYLGKSYELEIRLKQKNIIELSDKLYVASSNKKYAKNYILSWYKQQARKVISERVALYAKRAGLEYHSIGFTEAQTRWGSCSQEKNLHFNWKLIMAPLAVIDYVVAHELAHLVELNHSQDFWEIVRKMFPLYRQYRTWLKRFGHTLSV